LTFLAEGTRRPRNKNPERRTARAGWRSFGEYIFLEDSRYASQRKKYGTRADLSALRPVLDPSCAGLTRASIGKRASFKGWIAGSSPAMTTDGSVLTPLSGKPRLGVCLCGEAPASFRCTAKRATYCADGGNRQDQAERRRARDPGRAREEGAVARKLDHPPRQSPARERRRREGRRASGLLGLARDHHDRALFPRAAPARSRGRQAPCESDLSRHPISARPPEPAKARGLSRLQGRAELSL